MPTQSQYLPMVTLYFLLGITYTFMAYIWFIAANDYLTKLELPYFLNTFAVKVIKPLLFWKFGKIPLWKNKKVLPSATSKEGIKRKSAIAFIKTVRDSQNDEILEPERLLTPKIFEKHYKCFNCDICETCFKKKEAENTLKKQKSLIESNISALNYFMCFLFFWIMLACNLLTWLMVSHPPVDY